MNIVHIIISQIWSLHECANSCIGMSFSICSVSEWMRFSIFSLAHSLARAENTIPFQFYAMSRLRWINYYFDLVRVFVQRANRIMIYLSDIILFFTLKLYLRDTIFQDSIIYLMAFFSFFFFALDVSFFLVCVFLCIRRQKTIAMSRKMGNKIV